MDNKYHFGIRSLKNLTGVHPDLVKLMQESIKNSPYDFAIIEGLRSPERQREMYNTGKSQTLLGRHIEGMAIDLMVYVDGKGTWLNKYYNELSTHIKTVALSLNIPIIYGGDWRSIVDCVHYELDRKFYPGSYKGN